MNRVVLFLTIIFFIFILWVIYLANTGQSSVFFELVKMVPYGDKFGHILLFGFLTLGINISTKYKVVRIKNIPIFIGTISVFIFVLIEELSQSFVLTRTMDIDDFYADIIGITVFTIGTYHLKKRQI